MIESLAVVFGFAVLIVIAIMLVVIGAYGIWRDRSIARTVEIENAANTLLFAGEIDETIHQFVMAQRRKRGDHAH